VRINKEVTLYVGQQITIMYSYRRPNGQTINGMLCLKKDVDQRNDIHAYNYNICEFTVDKSFKCRPRLF